VQAASDGWHYAEGAYNAKNTGATDEGPFVSAVAAAAGLAQHIRTHKRVRPKRARMARLGPGNYIYEDEAHVFELQQPHAMFAEDPDRHWYGELDGEVMGPYDNKREAVAELQALLDQD
jgi:hypothetical protein